MWKKINAVITCAVISHQSNGWEKTIKTNQLAYISIYLWIKYILCITFFWRKKQGRLWFVQIQSQPDWSPWILATDCWLVHHLDHQLVHHWAHQLVDQLVQVARRSGETIFQSTEVNCVVWAMSWGPLETLERQEGQWWWWGHSFWRWR